MKYVAVLNLIYFLFKIILLILEKFTYLLQYLNYKPSGRIIDAST